MSVSPQSATLYASAMVGFMRSTTSQEGEKDFLIAPGHTGRHPPDKETLISSIKSR